MSRVVWPQLSWEIDFRKKMLVEKGLIWDTFCPKIPEMSEQCENPIDLGNDRIAMDVFLTPDVIK